MNWNLLGIIVWLIILLYLLFICFNIRKRHLKMIVVKHKRFLWSTFLIDIAEIIVFLLAICIQVNNALFDNPALDDTSRLKSSIRYKPLVLSTGTGKSYYVTCYNRANKQLQQNYVFYSNGRKYTVSSSNVVISDGEKPLNAEAKKLPYQSKKLLQLDEQYQKAYIAIYGAKYKNTWQNGLGMHVGKTALKYYLVRVPDPTFVRNIQSK
ncbi:LVIS_2131 family protein [Lactobacillus psittaci]|uniref:Uncharacterized protein n=1 Tax=Lactobacillus psittaci DSM 15354 TaxID=1122152 RepID=A0A0R1S341_9LACO|nr:LVIS_2131 family protein [Lactobacillus psittaci]KRL63361.1 hypothetical protein FC23_GL000931 [Lactobacillus psittaci DSM 15354]